MVVACRPPPRMLLAVCRIGWVQFQSKDNWWDAQAGWELPDVMVFTGESVDVWETLGEDLTQSRWATSTRRLYQGWLSAFLLFCSACSVEPLPIDPFVLRDWLTRLATNYASGTVQIAASAVIGFCALNNFKNPLVEHPVCKLVVKAAKRIRCGVTKDKRAALDAEFILDIWRVLAVMKGLQPLTIKQRRARCFTQLAFEAALRGGELAALAVCDVAFVACGPACGHSCQSHVGSDAYVFCRLHKTAQAGSVKVVRIVAPERPTMVGDEPVSAVHCLDRDWLPFLRGQGRNRHPGCRRTFASKFRCEMCPALFCTFPTKCTKIVRPIDISDVTETFKKFAVLTQRSPVGYSSHSGRIGSFSDATALVEDAVDPTAVGCDLDEDLVARSLGWKGKRTPKAVRVQAAVAARGSCDRAQDCESVSGGSGESTVCECADTEGSPAREADIAVGRIGIEGGSVAERTSVPRRAHAFPVAGEDGKGPGGVRELPTGHMPRWCLQQGTRLPRVWPPTSVRSSVQRSSSGCVPVDGGDVEGVR